MNPNAENHNSPDQSLDANANKQAFTTFGTISDHTQHVHTQPYCKRYIMIECRNVGLYNIADPSGCISHDSTVHSHSLGTGKFNRRVRIFHMTVVYLVNLAAQSWAIPNACNKLHCNSPRNAGVLLFSFFYAQFQLKPR